MLSEKERKDIELKGTQDILAENLGKHIAKFCSLGEKVAGSKEEEASCNYIVDELKKMGLEPKVDIFEAYISEPISASIQVYFPEKFSAEGVGISFNVNTPEAGLSGDMIYCGLGTPEDYEKVDVRGKIALIGKLANPDTSTEAAKHGALALVAMSEGIMKHKMIASPIWGVPGIEDYKNMPRIPVVSVSGVAGVELIRLCKSGQAKATVHVESWEGWRNLRLPSVEIKGKRKEFLLVGAHYCSWFDGATDNATGNSALLELARQFAKYQDSLEYGIRFAWWPGHSQGRYAGSAYYADSHWQELFDNCIGYFNIDSPGTKGATVYVPRHQMAEVSAFNEGCIAELTKWSTVKSIEGQLTLGARFGKANPTRPSRAADQSFWGVGVTSIGVYSMLSPDHPDRRKHVGGSAGAWWWHSIDDTLDKSDPKVLEQDTRLYWAIQYRIVSSVLVPYDFTDTVCDYQEALGEYAEAAGNHFDFSSLSENLDKLKKACADFRKKALSSTDEKTQYSATQLCLQLGRILIPTLYTQVQPTEQQPALGVRFLADLQNSMKLPSMDPQSWEYKFTRVSLFRKLNKVNHAVITALRAVENWNEA